MSEGRQLSIESELLLYEIRERGAALIEHGLSDVVIETCIDAYTEFTSNLPDPEPETMDAMLPDVPEHELAHRLDDLDRSRDKQKEWHKYRTNIPWIAKPGGYTNRSFQTKALEITRNITFGDDPKEYYHYFPGGKPVVERQHRDNNWGPIPQEYYRLDTAFLAIHTAGRLLTEQVLSQIEDVHPEVRKIITPQAIADSPVRLLFYHQSESEELGAGHYDKGMLTFQIAESHEGLRIAKDDNSPLEMVRRAPHLAAFFPSSGLGSNEMGEYPNSPFSPGWHDIIKSSQLNEGRTMSDKTAAVCARWAIIFFTGRENFIVPDKALTHNR